MKHILCFGDSNTYGFTPEWIYGKPGRYDDNSRWPCILQSLLGADYRIIEEGLSGRTTVFDDPTIPGRRGLDFISICVESHMPIDLVILMLGTNDCKSIFNAAPFQIAEGMGCLVKAILNPYAYFNFPLPKVLVVAPAPMGDAALALGDSEMIAKSQCLAAFYEKTAQQLGCEFLDLAPIVNTSSTDGIHLSAEGHKTVALEMAKKVQAIFSDIQ